MGEHQLDKLGVTGSSPVPPISRFPERRRRCTSSEAGTARRLAPLSPLLRAARGIHHCSARIRGLSDASGNRETRGASHGQAQFCRGHRGEALNSLQSWHNCHLGFWLGLGAHFVDDDPRLPLLGDAVLSAQFEDGGWNCHMRNYPNRVHSSFHTTFNVLENLRIATVRGIVPKQRFAAAEARAVELLLEHRLYRSDRTGEVISERFTQLTYPWHWHYTFLRGLDYLRLTPAVSDRRLADPIDLLREKRKPNGRWPLQKRIPGTLLVEMEKPGTGQSLEHAAGAPRPTAPREGKTLRGSALLVLPLAITALPGCGHETAREQPTTPQFCRVPNLLGMRPGRYPHVQRPLLSPQPKLLRNWVSVDRQA